MPPKRKAVDAAGDETAVKKARPIAKPRAAAAPKAEVKKVVPPKKATAEKKAPAKKAEPAKKATAAKKTEAAKPNAAPKKAAPKKAAPKEASPAEESESESESESEDEKPVAKKVAPKKASPKKVAPKKKATPAEESESEPDDEKPAAKKAKTAPKPKAAAKPKAEPKPKVHKFGPTINQAPTQKLSVYVFGEGSAGELGLGSKKIDNRKPIDVKRPRLNELLTKAGIVEISVGGMHSAAITHDNKILTWGVNDQGALGRDTHWEGGLKDMEEGDSGSDSDSDDEDSGLNPHESTPAAVDPKHFPEGTKFTNICACDSATFVVTHDGSVYGWGTFRSNEGILGFTEDVMVQFTPLLIPQLKKIVTLCSGANHILALDAKANVFAWGAGQQNQLGRRVVERTRAGGLVPREFGLPRGKIDHIASGSYHSFAVDKKGQVWTWGLNSFGETGITEGAGEDSAVIPKPTIVKSLKDYNIKQLSGGSHHTIAVTTDGKVLAWGRSDAYQLGVDITTIDKDDVVFNEAGKHRMVKKPIVIPDLDATFVDAGGDNSFAITKDGKAYSWGFSENYQTGQGTEDDVEVATLIDNTAVRGKTLTFAGAGGQYSILAGPLDTEMADADGK